MSRVVNPTILPRHTFWVSDAPYIKAAPANALPVAANPIRNQPAVAESFIHESFGTPGSENNSIELLRPYPKLYYIAKQIEQDQDTLKEMQAYIDEHRSVSEPPVEHFVDTVPTSFPEDRHLFYANRIARDPRYTPKTHWSMQQKTFHRKLKQYIEFFYFCRWYQVACKLRQAWEATRRAAEAVAARVREAAQRAAQAVRAAAERAAKAARDAAARAAQAVKDAAARAAKAARDAATRVAQAAKNTYNNVKGSIGGCCRSDQSRFGLNCGLNCSKQNPPMTDWGLFCGRGGKVKAKHTFGKKSRAKERAVMFGSDIEYGDD